MSTAARAALLTRLQERLGYTFRDLTLLDCALTHTSYTHEAAEAYGNYERLEFLGDAVLGLIVSAYLYGTYPASNEGQLSKLRACIVSERGLTALAQQLELGRYLLLGRGEEQTGGRHKSSLLTAGFEAVMAALYLDGGLGVAREVFLRCFGSAIERRLRSTRVRDYKGLLQQQALRLFGSLPTYRTVHEEGPAHQKIFHVQLTLARSYYCVGVGRSKKAAEQHAAKQLLQQLQPNAQR